MKDQKNVIQIDFDLFKRKINELAREVYENTEHNYALPVLAIHEIAEECVIRGKWITTWDSDVFVCDNCRLNIRQPVLMGKPTYKCCPYCFADMRGGEKE